MEKPVIADTEGSDTSSRDGKNEGDTGKAVPIPKQLPVPVPIPASGEASRTGVERGKEQRDSGAGSSYDTQSSGSFAGGVTPPFYNYPGLYGSFPPMMPSGSMYGAATGGAANNDKNHSTFAAVNASPADVFGAYGAPSWMSQFTSNWPQHFPDFMQQPSLPIPQPKSHNGRTDGKGKEPGENNDSASGSSQDIFGNTDSVDDSLQAFDSLLGLSNTSSSDSTAMPTTRGSSAAPEWHPGYSMPPYMPPYRYPMQATQPSGSGTGGMAYMPPLYHSHPSFMSGGYVHSMPPPGMAHSPFNAGSQSPYSVPPISTFDAGRSVEKLLQCVASDDSSQGDGDKGTSQSESLG